jgi:hypothetical protein
MGACFPGTVRSSVSLMITASLEMWNGRLEQIVAPSSMSSTRNTASFTFIQPRSLGLYGRVHGRVSCHPEWFASEGSLSLYLGISTLDNRSGKYQGTKAPKHVNTRAKAAMMIGVDRHRKSVPESQRYCAKKRSEGKKHNQAVRSLGRHLYKMLTEEREYRIGPEKRNTKAKVGPRSFVKTKIRRPKISAKV